MSQRRRPLGRPHRLVDRQPLDARHRRRPARASRPVDQEDRPDQVVGGEPVLPHQAARPIRLAVAARAMRQGKRGRSLRATGRGKGVSFGMI